VRTSSPRVSLRLVRGGEVRARATGRRATLTVTRRGRYVLVARIGDLTVRQAVVI
jgi:hypothetical protein